MLNYSSPLLRTGEIHNYARMLWGKLVIQWCATYEEAFELLEDMNNKYALDGRNPNSYAGILWCFGKHDRAGGAGAPGLREASLHDFAIHGAKV